MVFGDFWWEIDLREGRDGRILALIVAHAIGRESGVAATGPLANLWTFEEGLAKRLEIFLDRAAAIEAAASPE